MGMLNSAARIHLLPQVESLELLAVSLGLTAFLLIFSTFIIQIIDLTLDNFVL